MPSLLEVPRCARSLRSLPSPCARAGLLAQTAGAPPAPKDRAVDFSSSALDAAARDLVAKGLITQRVLEGGAFSINVRHIAGAETALSHGVISEVWVVREGSGTLATGGTLVNPTPGTGPGELRGTRRPGRCRAGHQSGGYRVRAAWCAARHQGLGRDYLHEHPVRDPVGKSARHAGQEPRADAGIAFSSSWPCSPELQSGRRRSHPPCFATAGSPSRGFGPWESAAARSSSR